MENSRWWHVAVLGTGVVLISIVLAEQDEAWRTAGALSAIALLVIAWFSFGRFAWRSQAVRIPFAVVIVLLIGIGCGFDSTVATLQCIAFPLIWTLLERLRDAVYGNIAVAVSAGIGIYLSSGATLQSLVLALIIEGVSLAFSLAMGTWITSIAERSDERQRLIVELEAAQTKLGVLSRAAGAAEERERLSRELHDTIAQDLTGLVMTAERSRRALADGNLAAAAAALASLEENARSALAETRAMVASGAAVGVGGGGLATALVRIGERIQRETGIRISVAADDPLALDRDSEVVLLRCAQEALSNVRKHSTAASATLTLASSPDGVTLTITDDGLGFDPATRSGGFGLDGMRERLSLVDGTLAVTSNPGGGTSIAASLPRVRAVSS
jgi:signal transduction histidine kinase